MGGFELNTFFSQIIFVGVGALIVFFLFRYLLTKKRKKKKR
ncbi:hypothetical protein J32TS6_23380 [Virgibacillus pantothenticus]|nr:MULTISPECIES: hypothetical protein [Bacillaceae]GIP63783.1 hypothetical protein J32TS6_23380 [Virgibacillus pantothenticus]